MRYPLAIVFLLLFTAPVKADYYHHSYPDIGPTGVYCTSTYGRSYGTTRCSRGLTKEEMANDKAMWDKRYRESTKRLGLASNHCEVLVPAKAEELYSSGYLFESQAQPSAQEHEVFMCRMSIADGERYTPYRIAQRYKDGGCDPGHPWQCQRMDFDWSDPEIRENGITLKEYLDWGKTK